MYMPFALIRHLKRRPPESGGVGAWQESVPLSNIELKQQLEVEASITSNKIREFASVEEE